MAQKGEEGGGGGGRNMVDPSVPMFNYLNYTHLKALYMAICTWLAR